MKTFAAISLFCYKRSDALAQAVETLQKKYLATESDLLICSDSSKKIAHNPFTEESFNNANAKTDFIALMLHSRVEVLCYGKN